jgi:hypothetical protein
MMQPFLAMLLTLRIGLVPGPTDGAILSIRDQVLHVAMDVAERDTFVARESPPVLSSGMRLLSSGKRQLDANAAQLPDWAPPATVQVLRREDIRDMIADTLNGNQTIANAAMWLAAAPVRLRVSHEKIFVAITVRIP